MKVKLLSCVQLFVTPWTVAYHTPPSMGFSRQKCWSGLPFLKMVQNLPTSCTSCRLNPHDQLGRLYAGPTAGPETSTALEGILGRQGRLRLSVRKRTPTAVIQENQLLFLCFDLFCRFFWTFFFSFPSLLYLSVLLALRNLIKLLRFFFFFFFFPNHTFYCCYKPLPLFWLLQFYGVVEFSSFFSFVLFCFLILIF